VAKIVSMIETVRMIASLRSCLGAQRRADEGESSEAIAFRM
jgi:hypothetical protein